MNYRGYRLKEKKEKNDKYKCKDCNRNFDKEEYLITDDKYKCIFHCNKLTWITKVDPKDDDYNLGTEIAYFWDENKVVFFGINSKN